MVDSFINYGNNQDHISSPTYLNKAEDDAFTFDFNPNDQFRFLHFNQDQYPVNAAPNMQDGGSNHSTHSTTHSSKHSPAYTPNTGEHYDENDPYSKVPPIVRKGIRKFYEPILDGGAVFKYEEDPNEYRKARKRIQNRESATRVRNRKKNHVEILEDEITLLKQEKADLKVLTSKLMAENNMLKQQIAFLERRPVNAHPNRGHPEGVLDMHDDGLGRVESDAILHEGHDPNMQNAQVDGYGYYRNAPTHKFKRHIALLGVFTLMLCVYGLVSPTGGLTSLVGVGGNGWPSSNSASNSIIISTNESDGINVQNKNKKRNRQPPHHGRPDMDMWNEPWDKNRRPGPHNNGWRGPHSEEGNNSSSYIITIIELVVLLGYLGYLLYVGISFYKHQKKRNNVETNDVQVVAI